MRKASFVLVVMVMLGACTTRATETANIGMRVLPAPGRVAIDGKPGDWDLSGGIFVCKNVEQQRDRQSAPFGIYIHETR